MNPRRSDDVEELDLTARLRGRDPEAYRVLLERYEKPLYSFLRRTLRDLASAEDVFAEVFVRVLGGIDRYQARGRLSAWLFTIAHRLCLDQLEKEGRRAATPLDAPGPGGLPPLSDRLADSEPGPERGAEGALVKARIEEALAGLPEEQKQVFLLREYGGLSFAEIADALDCPLSTALARMRYAVLKLRRELEDLAHD